MLKKVLIASSLALVLLSSNVTNASAQQTTSNSLSPSSLKLFNYVSQKDDVISDPDQLSIEKAAEYLPQYKEIIGVYMRHVNEGKTPIESIGLTYKSKEMSDLYKQSVLMSKQKGSN